MTTAYKHAEAFCLMLYRDTAGNEEWIWNSRDGVTPFLIRSRAGLEARHVEWHRDRRVPDHKPQPGDRIFVDLTEARAREIATKKVERFWDHPEFPMREHYASKDEAIEIQAKAMLEYGGGGQPDLIVVGEERGDG